MIDGDSIVQGINRQRGEALPQTVGNIDEDPDKAQRAMDLERVTGIPSTAIYGDLEEFERQHKATMASDIVANNPHLTDYVQSHPMAPKVSNDDYGNLDSVSQKVSGMSLPMRVLRAPEALAGMMFEGDPLKRYKEGGPLGSWLTSDEVKNHPVMSAVAAGLGTPVELFLRGVGGTIETLADAATAIGGREAGALVEAELMGLTGRHGVHPPVAEAMQRVRPWAENGREPLPTAIPEYDAYRAKQNLDDVQQLTDLTTDAQASLTRERSPDLFKSFIAQHTDAEIGVGPDAAVALYGDRLPSPDDGLLGWVPRIESKLEMAKATGDDISIPLADWVTHIDPEVMKALHDDIRVRPGGVTARESQFYAELEAQKQAAQPPPLPEPGPKITEAPSAAYPEERFQDRSWQTEELQPLTGDAATYVDDPNVSVAPTTGRLVYTDPTTGKRTKFSKSAAGKGAVEGEVGRAVRDKASFQVSFLEDAEAAAKQVGGQMQAARQEAISRNILTKGPLPDVVPNYRDATALEPLFSIGDRKLQLQRLAGAEGSRFGPEQGFHDFSMNDEKGNPVGTINLSEQRGGKDLYVEMINGINGLGPRDFGPSLMRDLLRQIKAEFPNAERLGGHRVSGAREAAGKEMTMPEAWIRLDVPKSWETAETSNEFRRILEGGQWQTYSPSTRAYIKPTPERTIEDRKIVQAVLEEVGRIAPKKLAGVVVADRIIAGAAKGQAGAIEPAGIYIRYRDTYPIILASLEGHDPLGTARHEAIHHLRNYGFFSKAEWATLEKAAIDNKWMDKFATHRQYPTADLPLKLEESIAEGYREWVRGAGAPSPEVHGIFEKIKALFTAIKERIAQILGKEPTWEDIFQKVSTGEVGSREGTRPLDARAFDERLSIDRLQQAANDNYLTPEEREVVEDHLQAIRSGRAAVEKMTEADANRLAQIIEKTLADEGKPKPTDLEFERWKKQFNDKVNKAKNALDEKLSAPEKLNWAAIRYNNKIYLGRTHAEAIEEAVRDTGKTLDQVADEVQGRPAEDSGGFYTSHNRYISRKEAEELIQSQPTNLQASAARAKEEGLHADAVRLGHGKTDFDFFIEEIDKDRPIRAVPDQALDERLSVPDEPSRTFERAAALGMTVDQFKRYDQLIAKRHAEDIETATKRAEAQKTRELTKEWKQNRADLRKEVAEDIRNRPDVATDLFLAGDGLYGRRTKQAYKLNADKLTEKQKAMLPPNYYGKDGLDPDDVANLFGYGSGEAMVDKLTNYNVARRMANMSSKDFVSRITDIETDRQMRIKYGVLEDNIMDAVKEQVVGQVQQDLLHEETVALGMKVGAAPLDKAAILAQLRDNFAKMSLSSVSSDAYLRAAGKSGKAAEMALLANDPATAFRAKQQQYYATVIANEAAKLEKDLTKFDKVAKRFSKREVPSVDPQYTNFIHDILQRVGRPVRRSVQDIETEIQAGEYKSLQEFVEGKNGFYLREVAVADLLFDPAFRKKFEDLTVDEFRAVDTSIKSLVKNGRDEKKITKAGQEADLDEVKGQMIEQLQQFQERTYDAKGGRWMGPIPPKIAKVLRTYVIAHIQMENLFNRWDRDNPQGVFQQYIMRDLVDASNNESVMQKRYAEKLRAIDDGADLKKLVDNPLFKVPGTDQLMKLNRGNLRTIMLNLGNDGNMSKLARGYGIKPEMLFAWVHQHATREDWVWTQKMWDVFADLKAEADVMYRHLSGVAPESIEIKPVVTPHGTFPGGYYPIIYHPEFEGPSKKLMGKDALEQEGFVRATTANGYTKQRTGYAGPMALDIDMLPARMNQMIHDVAMRPSVINASKIFYDKDIRGAIFKHFGAEWRDMLVPYLVDVANSANYVPKDQRMFYNVSEFIRQNIINTLVGLNPSTVLKHGPTAAVQSLHEVGPINFLKAVKGLFSINEATGERNWQFALRESEELQRRHQNYVETLGGATDMLMPQGKFMSLRSTVQRLSATPVAVSDLLSAVPTWLAQYEKSMAANGGIHGDAVFDANRAVRRAHGSVAITNRSSVMRGGALGQWFASVYGFFNHIMNRQYELLWKSGEALDLVKEGNYREAMQKAPELTSMLFAYVLAPALIEEMVTPLASSDNESWGKKAAKGVAFTLGASWVGIRDIASAILNGRDPTIGLMNTAAKTITDEVRDLSKSQPLSKEHAGKVVKDGASLLGALTGVVPAQVGRTGQFAIGVSHGIEHPKGPWGWLVGARYGTLKGHSTTFNEWMRHH